MIQDLLASLLGASQTTPISFNNYFVRKYIITTSLVSLVINAPNLPYYYPMSINYDFNKLVILINDNAAIALCNLNINYCNIGIYDLNSPTGYTGTPIIAKFNIYNIVSS